jgi:hypothetical protein
MPEFNVEDILALFLETFKSFVFEQFLVLLSDLLGNFTGIF